MQNERQKISNPLIHSHQMVWTVLFALFLLIISVQTASAIFSVNCIPDEHDDTRETIRENHDSEYEPPMFADDPYDFESFPLDDGTTDTDEICSTMGTGTPTGEGTMGLRQYITYQMKCHQIWLLNDFHRDWIVPMLQMMAEQLVVVGMHQTLIIGVLIDAEMQLETQRLFQRKVAEAHKDYHPSVGMCTFGSNVKSLGASARTSQFSTSVMSQRSLDRQLSMATAASNLGPREDREARLEQFISRYCNIEDNNFGFEGLCGTSANAASINKDIDFTRTVNNVSTLDINFRNHNNLTGDEQDVLALSSYLYGHDIFSKPTDDQLEQSANRDEYIEMRSVIAKRSVAENSYNAIIGMKSSGSVQSEETADTLARIMQQLDFTEQQSRIFLSDNPSYYAQMEVLTQRLYQSPDFYTNLYDKPANIARKDVAMQAIELMLERDAYKSELRSEALLAVILEMELNKYQKEITDKLISLDERGKDIAP